MVEENESIDALERLSIDEIAKQAVSDLSKINVEELDDRHIKASRTVDKLAVNNDFLLETADISEPFSLFLVRKRGIIIKKVSLMRATGFSTEALKIVKGEFKCRSLKKYKDDNWHILTSENMALYVDNGDNLMVQYAKTRPGDIVHTLKGVISREAHLNKVWNYHFGSSHH